MITHLLQNLNILLDGLKHLVFIRQRLPLSLKSVLELFHQQVIVVGHFHDFVLDIYRGVGPVALLSLRS